MVPTARRSARIAKNPTAKYSTAKYSTAKYSTAINPANDSTAVDPAVDSTAVDPATASSHRLSPWLTKYLLAREKYLKAAAKFLFENKCKDKTIDVVPGPHPDFLDCQEDRWNWHYWNLFYHLNLSHADAQKKADDLGFPAFVVK
jgi:hypothetical protein